MNYFMNDSAADMKRRLLGREPEKRFHWLTYGLVLLLCATILTLPIWAR